MFVYGWNGIATRKTRIKYKSPMFSSKGIANVKFFVKKKY